MRILQAAILAGGLLVVAALAQRLPVAPVPELQPVAPVGFDMVNHGGRHYQPPFSTTHTQRVVEQVQAASLLPVAVIATGAGAGPSVRCPLLSMRGAVARGRQLWATGVAAGPGDNSGHKKSHGGWLGTSGVSCKSGCNYTYHTSSQ